MHMYTSTLIITIQREAGSWTIIMLCISIGSLVNIHLLGKECYGVVGSEDLFCLFIINFYA